MIEPLPQRVREESGFTLIELLVVIIILGILLAIAVPSYLGVKDRADKAAAMANIRAIVPDIEQYNVDNTPGASAADDPDFAVSNTDVGYHFINATLLQAKYDQALDPTKYTFAGSTGIDYCVYTRSGKWFAMKHGPSGIIVAKLTPPTGLDASCD